MVTEKEVCVDEKWQSENGTEKQREMGGGERWSEKGGARERVCQECAQLTFSIHICGLNQAHIAIYGMVCARNEEPVAHTDRYSLKCAYAHAHSHVSVLPSSVLLCFLFMYKSLSFNQQYE